MTDPRNRLRPLVHSGVPHKVKAALDEIVRLADPALFDWLLEAAEVRDLAMSNAWNWKYDKTQTLWHPSLESEEALGLAAHGTSPLAAKLRKKLKRLGIELDSGRRENSHLDVSMIGGLPEVTYLRIMAQEIESSYEWRVEMAKETKLLFGFDMIAGMSSLERLVVLGAGGTSFAPLAHLRALEEIELVACDVKDTSELGRLAAKKLTLCVCPQIETLDVLPPDLEHLHVEDLSALKSLAGLATAKHLKTVEVLGVKIDLPKIKAKVTYQPERPARTKM